MSCASAGSRISLDAARGCGSSSSKWDAAASERTSSHEASKKAGTNQRRRALADMVTHYPTCFPAQILRSNCRHRLSNLGIESGERKAGQPSTETAPKHGLPGGGLAAAG